VATLDTGPAAYTGMANRERQYQVPVVGVVSKATSSWPGDERPGQMERMPLNPDHTHFVMLPSEDRYSSTNFRMKLAHHYSNNGALPAISFVVNGCVAAVDGVLATVRMGWPVVIIKGSGGLADRIADGKKSPGKYVTDPMLTEILQEGNLEFIEMSEVDGGLCQQMMDRIFSSGTSQNEGGADADAADSSSSDDDDDYDAARAVGALANLTDKGGMANAALRGGKSKKEMKKKRDWEDKWVPATFGGGDKYGGEPVDLGRQTPNLVTAWETHTMYLDNAGTSKKIAGTLALTLLSLGVLSTAVAALVEFIKKMDRERWDGVDTENAEDGVIVMNWVLFLVPIFASVMVAVENETRQGLKSALLQSGAEVGLYTLNPVDS
jgi:hypothetical protein